uniref:Uncharacterized protein n=1 Tax=viral metagenome TaxID=1070528 RepID=A0A6M3LZ17_9ZZZZ
MSAIPLCPHCNKPLRDWWERMGEIGELCDGQEDIVRCPHCHKLYTLTTNIDFETRSDYEAGSGSQEHRSSDSH